MTAIQMTLNGLPAEGQLVTFCWRATCINASGGRCKLHCDGNPDTRRSYHRRPQGEGEHDDLLS